MLNQTLNQTIEGLNGITFDSWTAITTSVPFIITIIAIVFIPFILYILIGSMTHARTTSGKKLDSVMIQNPNFWIPVIIWTIFQSALHVLIIYPFWLKFVS